MTFRPETDGCSELTCIYHGEENQRKIDEYNALFDELLAALPDPDGAALAQWDDDPNPYHGDYAENDGY